MCGRNASGGVHRRGARRAGGVGADRVVVAGLAGRGLAAGLAAGLATAGAGEGAGLPWTHVDRGRSHSSQYSSAIGATVAAPRRRAHSGVSRPAGDRVPPTWVIMEAPRPQRTADPVLEPTAAEFTPFGTSHLVAVLVLLLGAAGLVVLGRRREADPEDRFGKAFAVAMLLTTVPLQILYFTPAYWSLERTLPIQLCDLASVVSAYALWTHRPWAAGLTYYWGLTLTTQAIATPDLSATFPDPVFILFWAMHIGTVWAAVHLVWGRGVRPDWSSYRTAVAVTAAWAASVFVLNLAIGANYGYLNAKPTTATVLDLLGPWPWYVLAEMAIIAALWALVTWPWVALGDRRGALSGATPSGTPPGPGAEGSPRGR